jgi:hypothetical protein
MHCAVVQWIADAVDEDERERLSDLARFYLRWATNGAEQERVDITRSLEPDLSAYINAGGDFPDRTCSRVGFAYIAEGWAQTPGLDPLRSAQRRKGDSVSEKGNPAQSQPEYEARAGGVSRRCNNNPADRLPRTEQTTSDPSSIGSTCIACMPRKWAVRRSPPVRDQPNTGTPPASERTPPI